MNEVYVKVSDLGWISKYYFKDKDIITIEKLVGLIEELHDDKERLQAEIEEKEDKIYEMGKELAQSDPFNYGIYKV